MKFGSVQLLSGARLDQYQQKTAAIINWVSDDKLSTDATPAPPASMVVHPDSVIDLTAKMDAVGRLTWDVPPGRWTILRFGHTTTGVVNHPAPPEGTGLECDKLDRDAARAFWAGAFGPLEKKLGPLMGDAFNHVLIDSYEVGGQDWSPSFAAEFRARRGYDLFP
jgi:hypothetical protein